MVNNNKNTLVDIFKQIYPDTEIKRIEIQKEINTKYETDCKKRREAWTKQVKEVMSVTNNYNFSLGNSKPIIDAQAKSLNYRQALNAEIATYMKRLSGVRVELKELEQQKTVFYLTANISHLNVKQKGERDKMIEGNLRENIRTAEILETHIEFLRGTRDQLNNFQFALKNVIALVDVLSGKS